MRVFAIEAGTPRLVVELPDALQRTGTFGSLLAVGDLLPDLPASEIAVAQSDPQQPVHVFNVNGADPLDVSAVDVSTLAAPIRAIAVGR